MATGTGKTATAFQICWKLFQSKWNLGREARRRPRILFLADRNILADQAFNAFSAFDFIDENIKVRIRPDEIRKTGHVPKNGNLFFTIFQTFMSSATTDGEPVGEDPAPAAPPPPKPEDFHFGQYPPDFFDLIIIDECHRGGANDESSWRGIMEYFSPAVQLGLTATPKRDVNRDTYDYFGEPVYTYALKTGINDGFLTPFKVRDIRTNYDEYTFTSDDLVLDGEAEVGDTFTYRDYGRKIILQQVEAFRVSKFLGIINQRRKTLVFCATQRHAALVRDLINQLSDSSNPHYCQRVTADDGALGERSLREFQDNEKSIPTILTTSQKLSTGVDAPEIRNIVLLRPVDSMVEFKQIVGRGTRLYDGKDHFTVFDFVRAHEHFRDPAWDGEPLPPEPEPYTPPQEDHSPDVEEPPAAPCSRCGQDLCLCEDEPPRRTLRIRLSDNKEREIDATVRTSFWDPSGQPISSTEFMQRLYGDLPALFQDEAHLRRLWSNPGTREKLLDDLAERGYSAEQLMDLRTLVHGEDSDLFDVLGYVAYHKELVPRSERAARATVHLQDYDPAQQEFLNFVLRQYVAVGVTELGEAKMAPLLQVKYRSIQDAMRVLGDPKRIREVFIGFQQRLYGEAG